jgi:hypothetical protein
MPRSLPFKAAVDPWASKVNNAEKVEIKHFSQKFTIVSTERANNTGTTPRMEFASTKSWNPCPSYIDIGGDVNFFDEQSAYLCTSIYILLVVQIASYLLLLSLLNGPITLEPSLEWNSNLLNVGILIHII